MVNLSEYRSDADWDVVVVGAGFGGINAVYQFKEAGLRVRGYEAGSGPGGTWYWNRYPGCRVDIESLEYSYGFSDELQQAWTWPERYSAQPDVLRYLEWVVDRLGVRELFQFSTRVDAADWDDDAHLWRITTAGGEQVTAGVLLMAAGFLSEPHWPAMRGLETLEGKVVNTAFQGTLVHTGRWPEEGVQLQGAKLGIIGTAATTVQLLPVVAPIVKQAYVFQRTANWTFPMFNEPMRPEYEAYVKSIYPDIRQAELKERGPGTVLVDSKLKIPSDTRIVDTPKEEVFREFDYLWDRTFLHIALCFSDIMTDPDANNVLREYMTKRIRETVKDPATAELLIPKDHGPMTRRPPGSYGYIEQFNRDNVSMVDIRSDPIAEVTASGVKLASGRQIELDVLVCATGFDAGSGGLTRIPIRGRTGGSLREKWSKGARTWLGLMSQGFPNLFFVNAIQSPAAVFSPPLHGHWQNQYILQLLGEMARRDASSIEPTAPAEDAWIQECRDAMDATLIGKTESWWTGTNTGEPDTPSQPIIYLGGFTEYRKRACEALEDNNIESVYDFGPRVSQSYPSED